MENDIPRWLKISGESVKIFVGIVAIVGGILAFPWTKAKIEKAERKADSTLALLNSIQTQLQIQTQQQAQIQGQGQQQEQQMTNVQQVNPPNITILPDTSKKLTDVEVPIDTIINVPCNLWLPVPQSHDAQFRIECFDQQYDSIRIKARFLGVNNTFDSVATIGQERVFTDQYGSFRQIQIEFVEFWDKSPTHLYPKVRVKLVEENRVLKWKRF